MNEISIGLKKRFCKDEKVPINVFEEPYFSQRIELFGCSKKWNEFTEMIINDFGNSEQKFYQYYNNLKDTIIYAIKNSKTFMSMNEAIIKQPNLKNIRQSDVYKEMNVGKHFISIDMEKANFSSMVHYNKSKLNGTDALFDDYEWENFISRFTHCPHFKESKYLRQVVFGNCNVKRQVAYEKYLMDKCLTELMSDQWLGNCVSSDNVYSLLTDEIIIYADSLTPKQIEKIQIWAATYSSYEFPVRFEYFQLGKIDGTEAYVKVGKDTIEPKCVPQQDALFIAILLKNRSITSDDMVFSENGRLARYLEIPEYMVTPDEAIRFVSKETQEVLDSLDLFYANKHVYDKLTEQEKKRGETK